MGVAQKTTFSNPESLKKIFGVSGDLMEYNERGKPLKRLSSLTNPKSAGLIFAQLILVRVKKNLMILVGSFWTLVNFHPSNFPEISNFVSNRLN